MKKIYTIILVNPSDIYASKSFTSKKDAEAEFGKVRCDIIEMVINCKMKCQFVSNSNILFTVKDMESNDEYSVMIEENALITEEE